MTQTAYGVELLDRYAAVLIDAYGVLVTSGGALEGAAEFVSELERRGMPWAVVTNDASRSRETSSQSYGARGVPVPAERIVTSGSLLPGYFEVRDLRGAKTVVLGTSDSEKYAVAAGGRIVPWAEDAEVIVLADQSGYPFLEAFDATLSNIVRRVRRGDPVSLIVPNPDRVYPKGESEVGVTCGGIAGMMEDALDALLGADAPRFERLGKPQPAIFEAGIELVGTRDCVMFGDQLETDILGASRAGIDTAFVHTGVGGLDGSVEPTFVVHRLTR